MSVKVIYITLLESHMQVLGRAQGRPSSAAIEQCNNLDQRNALAESAVLYGSDWEYAS